MLQYNFVSDKRCKTSDAVHYPPTLRQDPFDGILHHGGEKGHTVDNLWITYFGVLSGIRQCNPSPQDFTDEVSSVRKCVFLSASPTHTVGAE